MKSTLNAERLISCRRQLGITQTEAADRIGVSQPAYQRYEAGVRTPSIQVIKEIAKVLVKYENEYYKGNPIDCHCDCNENQDTNP